MTKAASQFELRKTMNFESAHRLPHVPPGHKCARLHGHSFRVTVIVRGPIDPETGWVIDYSEIKKSSAPILEKLDHNFLNEIPGLENPTSEVLAQWFFDRLKPHLPALSQIVIHETCTTECRYPAAP
jgi:6-pyruvoyltetrahydropterin/6-carboxytetrahydropterin synthase